MYYLMPFRIFVSKKLLLTPEEASNFSEWVHVQNEQCHYRFAQFNPWLGSYVTDYLSFITHILGILLKEMFEGINARDQYLENLLENKKKSIKNEYDPVDGFMVFQVKQRNYTK